MSNPSERLTFGLVHGSWHGAWCWEFLQKELESAGHNTVAVDMPIEEPTANFEDYADVVADSLDGERNIVLVGHSRAGNVIPRVAGRIAVQRLIFLSSSFERETIGHPTEEERDIMPERNSPQFHAGIVHLTETLTRFDSEIAKELFYGDCPPDVRAWAARNLRTQRRFASEPELAAWPDIPQDYIVCSNDKILNPEWSRYVARNWLHIEPVEIATGHSPFLSAPKKLAAKILSLC